MVIKHHHQVRTLWWSKALKVTRSRSLQVTWTFASATRPTKPSSAVRRFKTFDRSLSTNLREDVLALSERDSLDGRRMMLNPRTCGDTDCNRACER